MVSSFLDNSIPHVFSVYFLYTSFSRIGTRQNTARVGTLTYAKRTSSFSVTSNGDPKLNSLLLKLLTTLGSP